MQKEGLIQAVVSTSTLPFTLQLLLWKLLVKSSIVAPLPLCLHYNLCLGSTVLPEALFCLPLSMCCLTGHPLWAPPPFLTSTYWVGLHPRLSSLSSFPWLCVFICGNSGIFILALNSNMHGLDVIWASQIFYAQKNPIFSPLKHFLPWLFSVKGVCSSQKPYSFSCPLPCPIHQ